MAHVSMFSGDESLWEQVWAYFVGEVGGLSDHGARNLQALTASAKGKLLATCMAIDIAAGAVSPSRIAEIFNHVADGPNDICDRLADELKAAEYEGLNCGSQLESPPLAEDDAYVTVMEISTFIRKHVQPNTGDGVSPEEIERVRKLYFEGDCDLSSLADCNLRPSNRLWVLSLSQFRQLLDQMNSSVKKDARIFLDALGLSHPRGFGPGNLLHLVAVIHPRGRDCGAKQPTSFDVYWRDTHIQFVSFGKLDGWGRTYSCTGFRYFESDEEGMPRERVHRDSRGLLGFTGQSLGYADRVDNLEQEMILKAALKRFARARKI